MYSTSHYKHKYTQYPLRDIKTILQVKHKNFVFWNMHVYPYQLCEDYVSKCCFKCVAETECICRGILTS